LFCACAGGRRVSIGDGCGEVLCKAASLPDVELAVTGDVARAGGVWCGLVWRIYAESESGSSVRGQVRVALRPGGRAVHVADVTVHSPVPACGLWDEAQAVLAALLWSRLRVGWMEADEPVAREVG